MTDLLPAGLRLAGQSLSVRGNSIQVRLQLLLRSGNVTVEYSDFQKEMTQYHVHVRRTQDNHTVRGVAAPVLSPSVPHGAAQVEKQIVKAQSYVGVNAELSHSHSSTERFLCMFYGRVFQLSWGFWV